MVELSTDSSAWQRYTNHLMDQHNLRGKIATVESMTTLLNREYNGIVFNAQDWRVYFKTEQDLTYFVLKWS